MTPPRVSDSKTKTSHIQSTSTMLRSSTRHRSTNLSTINHVSTLGTSSGSVSWGQATDFSSWNAKANMTPPPVSDFKTQTSHIQSTSTVLRSSTRHRSTNLSTTNHVSTFSFSSTMVSSSRTTDFSSWNPKASARLAEQLKPRSPECKRTVRTRAAKAPPKSGATTTITRNRGSKSKTETPADTRKAFCEICAEKKHDNEMIRINQRCSHSFCSICITNQVRTRITDNQARVPCLRLKCRQVVDFQTCAGILPQDVRDRWDRALCEALILAEQKLYCPFRDCSATLVNDGEVVIECECPHCHRSFCAQCCVPWHAGVSCQEFQLLNEDDGGTEDVMVRKFAAKKTQVGSRKAFCEICAEKKHNNEMIVINQSCCHSFCSICVTNQVRTRIADNQATVPCLGLGCNQAVEFQTCAGILPQDVRDRWDRALSEASILADHKFYCPFRDCSAMLVNDGEVVIEECECPHCHKLFCAQCRVPWHEGMSCQEIQALNEDERGTEDLMVRKLAAEKKWARCPKCKFFVERNEGCPHIICRCGFHFCYGCGLEWTKDHGGCSRS